jgi:ABC-type dipeptide/oligopeptide/nickel transport system permease subunit
MLSAGRDYFTPALLDHALSRPRHHVITVLAFNLLGDGIREALDPPSAEGRNDDRSG